MIKLRSGRISWAARIGAAGILTLGLAASLGIGPASAAAGSPAGRAACAGPSVSAQRV
jgi:hypothetical protein